MIHRHLPVLFPLLLVAVPLSRVLRTVGIVEGFTCPQPFKKSSTHRQRLVVASASTSIPSDQTPNELSRPLNTDRILKTSSGKQRRLQRDYRTIIHATTEECAALADRFDLKRLDSLRADLSLQPSQAYPSQQSSYLTVQVEGSIVASLTQTCVRTNEDFEVTVEFPLSAIVKPVTIPGNILGMNNAGDETTTSKEKNQKRSNSKIKTNRGTNNMNDMMALQQMIEEQEMERNTFSGKIDLDDEALEDESIYSAATGILDVGELVAQTFWLNLDPYPKKPGTGPVEYTITG